MWYEVNIELNGKHFFATGKRSITCNSDFEKVFPIIKQKFPKEEDYKITVTKWF